MFCTCVEQEQILVVQSGGVPLLAFVVSFSVSFLVEIGDSKKAIYVESSRKTGQ